MTKRKQTAAQLAAPFKTYTRAEALRLAASKLPILTKFATRFAEEKAS